MRNDRFSRVRESQSQFKTIASDRQEVARFEGEKEIVLYHNNSARDRDLSLVAVPDEDEEDPLSNGSGTTRCTGDRRQLLRKRLQ